MNSLYILLAAVIGYFLGAIPFGAIYVKLFKGDDLTKVGSGRTGGTNAMRAAGWKVGVLTGFSDVVKGIVAVLIVRWFIGSLTTPEQLPLLEVTTGFFTVVGHNWSIFLGGSGGAGTGPNVGWAAAVWSPIFFIGFGVMVSMIYFIGYASVASMTMSLIIPVVFGVLYWLGYINSMVYVWGSLATSLLVAFALRSNFQRLARGEERLVGRRAKKQDQQNISAQMH